MFRKRTGFLCAANASGPPGYARRIAFRQGGVSGRTMDFLVVLYEHAVVQNGNASRLCHLVSVELRRDEDDVVKFPLPGMREAVTSGGVWP